MYKFLPLLLAIAGTANAQTKHAASQDINTRISNFKQEAGKAASKGTATYWRIIARSDYQSSGLSLELTDSAKYVYSNGRSSGIDFEDMYVDDWGLQNAMLYDTAWLFSDNGSGIENGERYYCDYDANNKKKTFTQQHAAGTNSFENTSQMRGTRNANGDLTQEDYYFWISGNSQWEIANTMVHTYNGQNQPTMDSSYSSTGVPNAVTKYYYDGSGNLETELQMYSGGMGSLDSSWRDMYTYYGNGRIKTILGQEYINGEWHNSYYDSMGYGSVDVYTYMLSKEYDSSVMDWVNSYREERTLNSKNQFTSAKFYEWDGSGSSWDIQGEAEIGYDSYDNIVKLQAYMYLGGVKIPVPAYVSNLYYEYYFNVGVDKAPVAKQLTVYPNPAHSFINVVTDGADNANIQLVNMTGQTVRTAKATAGQQVTQLQLSGLPAGNYIMTVNGGNTTARQMITIQ